MSTTTVHLGTNTQKENIYKIIRRYGFNEAKYFNKVLLSVHHESIDGLALQLHFNTTRFKKMPVTYLHYIEFMDETGKFPNNPPALNMLKKISKVIPDLVYDTSESDATTRKLIPIKEYLSNL